jgi:hypothetical protein
MKLIGAISVTPVADWCFLKEAVLWIGFNKLPVAYGSYDDIDDGRFDGDTQYGLEEWLDSTCRLSDAECSNAGIPPDPQNEMDLEGIRRPQQYDEWIEKFPDQIALYSEGKKLAIEFQAKRGDYE